MEARSTPSYEHQNMSHDLPEGLMPLEQRLTYLVAIDLVRRNEPCNKKVQETWLSSGFLNQAEINEVLKYRQELLWQRD